VSAVQGIEARVVQVTTKDHNNTSVTRKTGAKQVGHPILHPRTHQAWLGHNLHATKCCSKTAPLYPVPSP